ncbi:hypothetical protein RvY_09327 [Ramazzottius varieornatus]|uniref:Glutamine amidotransferase type-2 domain-containing protein n=1 Tax=Ramazzottius varieornatus TaxID=947166 RepID=A0A1D1VEH2_RAMVA|nr:hypothetical protein RvY_09327 [Ramazzottius varieornatus]
MCGIFFSVAVVDSPEKPVEPPETTARLLQRRGPDFQSSPSDSILHGFCVSSSVLHVRAETALAKQPVVSEKGDILCWNGEIFQTGSTDLDVSDSDTVFLSDRLCAAAAEEKSGIYRVLSEVKGPFALVYYDRANDTLFFARDRFGRRSLIWMRTETNQFVLCSVLPTELSQAAEVSYGEVCPHGLFSMKIQKSSLSFTFSPWMMTASSESHDLSSELKHFAAHNDLHIFSLTEKREVQSYFSTETVKVAELTITVPDAINLAEIVMMTWVEITEKYPERRLTDCSSKFEWLQEIIGPPAISVLPVVQNFEDHLRKSVERRCRYVISKCKNCGSTCAHSKIAVLFSGGIDSLCVAYLAHSYVFESEPIDLLNVGFHADSQPEKAAIAPDRLTAIAGLEVLRSCCPTRQWNFVEIDVPKSEVDQVRSTHLWKLLTPQTTVLDCSIGTALWFAARGEGKLKTTKTEYYVSPARVVLSGLGADELLGGYSRHRTRLQRDGKAGLLEELNMDIRRIGVRNCGRDDRVISDHGREARYPFLDENLADFLCSLPAALRCNLTLPRGLGDKLLLRLLMLKLGFGPDVVMLEKRAMQFGTRIAKIDQTKKGTDLGACFVSSSDTDFLV